MIEITFRGRGGQGAVVASKLLAAAFHMEGWHVMAFPTFAGERRGAPVAAFLRVDREPIDLRCQVYRPDHLVILDGRLAASSDVAKDLAEGGWVIINTHKEPRDLAHLSHLNIACVDAVEIAVRHGLGSRTSPVVNSAILGAFAKATGLVRLESVLEAIEDGAPAKPVENRRAAEEAYHRTLTAEAGPGRRET